MGEITTPHYSLTEVQGEPLALDYAIAFIEGQDDDSYGCHVRQFTDYLRDRGKLDRQAVVDYFVGLNASSDGAGTKRVKRQAVKKRLRQLARAGGLGSDLSANLDQFLLDLDREGATKAPTTQPAPIDGARVMSPEEYKRVLEAARGSKQTLLLRFFWLTGCRVSELTCVRLTDCKIEGERVLINVTGKGNKQRTIRIPRSFYDDIIACFQGTTYLFESSGNKQLDRTNVSTTIAAVTKRTLGRPLRAHSLRHSFATRQIRHTGKIEAVSRYLGHSSPAITMQYYVHESLEDGELFDDEVVA